MITARADQAIRSAFRAIDDIADAMTQGIPVTHDGEPAVMPDGSRVMVPGLPLSGWDCDAADALASLLLLAGHWHAARLAIATHAEGDDDADYRHHAAKDLDLTVRLAYADNYLHELTGGSDVPAQPAPSVTTHYTFVRDWDGTDAAPVVIVVEADPMWKDPLADARTRALAAGEAAFTGFEDRTFGVLEAAGDITGSLLDSSDPIRVLIGA